MKDKKKSIIGEKEIREAWETLQKYKQGKQSLENRIVEEEMFFKQRHWELLKKPGEKTKPSSGWMFNAIINKHADAMDNYPEAIALAREASDEESAKSLTKILPVVLERNDFEEVYSDSWWYKLKHGCCAYGIFWNSSLEDGRGDIQIKGIDLLNIFWEPGIKDIQKSRNLFICDLVDVDVLKGFYPDKEIKGGEEAEIKKYIYDDNVDTSGKALVVDWYYKKDGKLHFCKFCEKNVLFASENESGYDEGWYIDGEYPIEFDRMYPEEGTPTGLGVTSVTKDAQLYIDTLDNLVMDNANIAGRLKLLVKKGSGVNEKDVLNPEQSIIEVDGEVDERRVRQLTLQTLNSQLLNFRNEKVNELKETSSNRDFSQGGTAGGVTSGAAIAVLQEAGNKTSRDTTKSSYRAFRRIIVKVIERMRQFYDLERTFRILGENGNTEFISFNNVSLVPQSMGNAGGKEFFRKPIFDIKVVAQKQNPYSTLSQNETVFNLYKSGVFAPENAQAAMTVLELMEFEGKEKALDFVKQGMTLQNQLAQMQQTLEMLARENEMLRAGNPSTASGAF